MKGRPTASAGSHKPPASALKRRVLREEIRDELINGIMSGRFAPGDRLIETRIARQFDVSQAPVREALRDLEMFGFVVSTPFRGAVVREVSVDELVQIYPIRAALEGLAAREAASRINKAGLRRLERSLLALRRAAEAGKTRVAVDADYEFHLAIVEASGSALLRQIWERMRLATTTSLTVARSHHSLAEIADRHEPVLQALRDRDPVAAEQRMRLHIEEPGQWLRASMESLREELRPMRRPARSRRRRVVRPRRPRPVQQAAPGATDS
jgi:DNA-binding GntR family transcriptional regulator